MTGLIKKESKKGKTHRQIQVYCNPKHCKPTPPCVQETLTEVRSYGQKYHMVDVGHRRCLQINAAFRSSTNPRITGIVIAHKDIPKQSEQDEIPG